MARRSKEDANKTRELILEQAASLFEQKSYDGVTIDEIASSLGLTKGAVFHHFKTKKALFTTIWFMLQAELHERLFTIAAENARNSPDPYAGIMASVRAYVSHIRHNTRYKHIVMICGPKVFGMDEWIKQEAEFGLARVKDGLRYLVKKNVLADTKDLDPLAQLLLGTLNYAALAMRENADSEPLIANFELLARGLDTRPKNSARSAKL